MCGSDLKWCGRRWTRESLVDTYIVPEWHSALLLALGKLCISLKGLLADPEIRLHLTPRAVWAARGFLAPTRPFVASHKHSVTHPPHTTCGSTLRYALRFNAIVEALGDSRRLSLGGYGIAGILRDCWRELHDAEAALCPLRAGEGYWLPPHRAMGKSHYDPRRSSTVLTFS